VSRRGAALPSRAMPSSSAAPDSLPAANARYWRAVVRLTLVLLALWAVLGLGCGVLFADVLNGVRLGGFPLGFWFAQQGAIVGFVLLILVYVLAMRRLDRAHRADLARLTAAAPSAASPTPADPTPANANASGAPAAAKGSAPAKPPEGAR
jgi:putative solute:sodium symporter small subunit